MMENKLTIPPKPDRLWMEQLELFPQKTLQEQTLQDYINTKISQPAYNQEGQGIKHDQGKQRFDLIPFDLMSGEQKVWEFGAQKYSALNWRKGMPLTQPLNAALRHLTEFMAGEDNDPESLQSHLDHAICCIRMCQNTVKYYPKLDDRNKWSKPEP
jgi:hypothetical protein